MYIEQFQLSFMDEDVRIHDTILWRRVVAENFVILGAVELFRNVVLVFSGIVSKKPPNIIPHIGSVAAIIIIVVMVLAVTITIISIASTTSINIMIPIIKPVIIYRICLRLNYV